MKTHIVDIIICKNYEYISNGLHLIFCVAILGSLLLRYDFF